MAQPKAPKRTYDELKVKFAELCEKSVDDQQELFLKSFIFALGEEWKLLNVLNKTYKKYVIEGGENKPDLNVVQASDFLQKNGAERTATQRKQEITDIDLDNNNRISFCEYLLLQYKGMILTEYYKRTGETNNYDLSKNGVGITGVGYQLLDELFTIPTGLDPELERAIEELTAIKKARENKAKDLQKAAAAGTFSSSVPILLFTQTSSHPIHTTHTQTHSHLNSRRCQGWYRSCSIGSNGSRRLDGRRESGSKDQFSVEKVWKGEWRQGSSKEARSRTKGQRSLCKTKQGRPSCSRRCDGTSISEETSCLVLVLVLLLRSFVSIYFHHTLFVTSVSLLHLLSCFQSNCKREGRIVRWWVGLYSQTTHRSVA
jgi:hypothetical protein